MADLQVQESKKTVVLVHGAFANSASWSKVIPLLQAAELNVVAVHLPLSSLAADAEAARRAIEAQTGEVILVGHSWGGTVITQAGNHEKVAALVYVAAFAPSIGQSVNDLFADYPQPAWLGGIQVDSGGFVSLLPETVSSFFAQDLTATETNIMSVTQGPLAASCNDEKATEAAWTTKPSWYVVAQNDRIINPDLERALAKKLNAETTELTASHVAMLAKPQEVADVIIAAGQSAQNRRSTSTNS